MRLCILFMILGFSAVAVASEGDIGWCKRIENDVARLSCYDSRVEGSHSLEEKYFGKAKIEETPKTKSFVVKELSKSTELYTIVLGNGQIWRQQEPYRGFQLTQGEKVIITSGAFSSYYMRKEESSAQVPVRRLK